MNKQKLIDYIKQAYNEAKLEEANEDKYGTPDYIEDFDPHTTPTSVSDEEQYAIEFGWMMAREGYELVESEYDEYLEQILDDSDSRYKLKDLV